MDCAVGSPRVEVEPNGCEPVSEDICDSGYMAPIENINFPENPLPTCCKCREEEGGTCKYCMDENNCTPYEKSLFVTNRDCFADIEQVTPPPEEEEEIPEEQEEVSSSWYIIAVMVALIFAIGMVIRRGGMGTR